MLLNLNAQIIFLKVVNSEQENKRYYHLKPMITSLFLIWGGKGFSKVLWTEKSLKFISLLSTTKTSEFLT